MIANKTFKSKIKVKYISNQAVWLQIPTPLTILMEDIILPEDKSGFGLSV